MKKTTTDNKLRCRFCYAKLAKPQCENCAETRAKAGRILGAANQIFLARGTYLDGNKNPFEKLAPVIL